MRGVLCEPETIFQITTFGQCKHVEYMSNTSILSLVTIPTPLLRSSGCGGCLPQSHNVIPEAIFEIHCVHYFSLRQEHEVIITQLYHPECLRKAEVTDISDIIHPEDHPGGMGRSASRRRRLCVNPVVAMAEWGHEADWYYSGPRRTTS